ncbi:hypothetical protein BDY21DRAFT_365089 [Lineolata rhizophorae]|uniref:Mid2 domain-containing protein n=1 Tax=Lineolata rhizophorae TaxID=578093 RepID=A0A6A6NVV2_9PEZI|nr:hypothetical protein BDY21DRAFT_365089 [Lineolata rhizophorae]
MGPALLPGESAIVCCPSSSSGYGCLEPSQCSKSYVTTVTSTLYPEPDFSTTGDLTVYTSAQYTTSNVYAIQVRWQASDLSVLETDPLRPGQSPTPSTSSSSIIPLQTGENSTINADSDDSSDNSGLSTGAKIGIGVGVPVGVLAVAAAGFLLFWRHRKRKQARQPVVLNQSGAANNTAYPGPHGSDPNAGPNMAMASGSPTHYDYHGGYMPAPTHASVGSNNTTWYAPGPPPHLSVSDNNSPSSGHGSPGVNASQQHQYPYGHQDQQYQYAQQQPQQQQQPHPHYMAAVNPETARLHTEQGWLHERRSRLEDMQRIENEEERLRRRQEELEELEAARQRSASLQAGGGAHARTSS